MKEPESKCYYYALSYINRYPKTEKELKVKLMEKWFSEYKINEAIEFLKFKMYVDDENFVKLYVNSEIIRKWKPVFVIRKKLYQKGVDNDLVKVVFEELEEEMQEWIYNKIKKEIEKYKSKWVDGFDIIQKLMRKWYKIDEIKHVVASS